jgi:hypothetical protein
MFFNNQHATLLAACLFKNQSVTIKNINMKYCSFFLFFILILIEPSCADDLKSRQERIFADVIIILTAQRDGGEIAAVKLLQQCYRRHKPVNTGLTPALETCIVQDIAYANIADGWYREMARRTNKRQFDIQTKYTKADSMIKRTDDALLASGLREPEMSALIKTISKMSIEAVMPAMEMVWSELKNE